MRIVHLSENINPEFSLTHVKGDVYNVFGEEKDYDFGNFHKSRLLTSGWTQAQLNYVKKHGTTNFVRSKK